MEIVHEIFVVAQGMLVVVQGMGETVQFILMIIQEMVEEYKENIKLIDASPSGV